MTETAIARPRVLLTAASIGVFVSSADTYVIVIALTAIMSGIGLDVDKLQQATPIISGFLAGYVVALPVLGKLSDLYGRRRILMVCLAVFATGSVVTASATTLAAAVIGRALQGLGGGGLVPVAIALVADIWPAEKRSGPLGAVSAVQELGSVIGPLWGAAIISLTSWRVIFWINIPVALLIALAARSRVDKSEPRSRDWIGWILLALALLATTLAVVSPAWLQSNDTVGLIYAPILTASAWSAFTTPVALASYAFALAFLVWCSTSARRIVDLRAVFASLRQADYRGALLLALVLTSLVVSFAAADPSKQVLGDLAYVLLPVAAVALLVFVIVESRRAEPLINFGNFRDRAAFGSLLANLAIGIALVTALVDVPIFARTTAYPTSQVDAALVLTRLLVAIPVGALLGGFACRRLGYRAVAAVGMVLCTLCFVAMGTWGENVLTDSWLGMSWLHPSDPALLAGGLGFGLAIAPINAAMLGAVTRSIHGLASSLVVLARMVGMLIGVSLLTALGLHRFYQMAAAIPTPSTTCPSSPTSCAPYDNAIEQAIISELHVIFVGAAIAAAVAALLSLALLRRRPQVA